MSIRGARDGPSLPHTRSCQQVTSRAFSEYSRSHACRQP